MSFFRVGALVCAVLGAGIVLTTPIGGVVEAATLTQVSELINASAPGAQNSHLIQFTVPTSIPASGRIVLTPINNAFVPESGFDFVDMDVAVSNGGPFADRSLAALPSATDDGISISGGVITITLNSTTGIAAGERVRITLGQDSIFGGSGVHTLLNAGTPGSYKIAILTLDQGGAQLDAANAMIAITLPVSVTSVVSSQPPARVNGLPSGLIAAGNGSIELSFETNEAAVCRYDTLPNIPYASMTHTFSSSGGVLFYTTVTGHQNSMSYDYYIRCLGNVSGLENTDDYTISFTLDAEPISNTSVSTPGSSGRGGIGSFRDGSNVLFLGNVTLSGWTSPLSTIVILKDGVANSSVQSGSDGSFKGSVADLERGVYTFTVFSKDSRGRKSNPFTATLSLEAAGAQSSVTSIVLPPTIELPQSIGVGDEVRVTGESVPGSVVDLYVTKKGAASVSDTIALTATSTSGTWEIVIPKGRLVRNTYSVQARARVSQKAISRLTEQVVISVGEGESSTSDKRGDLNGDAKVNLTDFSILLSMWGKNEPRGDLNSDGTVNLADFSILLFNWTG